MLDTEALPGLTRAERVQAARRLAGRPAGRRGRRHPAAARRAAAGRRPRTGTDGVALVAVGGLGRRELPPHGDLDLVLVHDGRPEVAALADALWYPVWDAGLRLDHSVRSVAEAVGGRRRRPQGRARPARRPPRRRRRRPRPPGCAPPPSASWRQAGVPAAARSCATCAAGGPARSASWRSCSSPTSRRPAAGCATSRCCGRWPPPSSPTSRRPRSRRPTPSCSTSATSCAGAPAGPTDVLVRQEQRPVAGALRPARRRRAAARGQPGRPAARLRRRRDLAPGRGGAGAPAPRPLPPGAPRAAGRRRGAAGRRGRARPRRRARPPTRGWCCGRRGRRRPGRPAALPVHAQGARGAQPAAARAVAAGGALVVPAAAGQRARPPSPVLEQLDQEGLLSRLLPGVGPRAPQPQRNPCHRFTVDRHLVEAAAAAAELTRDVDRPDLLLLGALLHDIGKGWPGDHTDVGSRSSPRIAARMGFAEADVAVLGDDGAPPPAAARRRHPPRPRRPRDRDRVADAVGGDAEVLELLHALAEADGAATGPSAWSPWKAHLVAALVARVQALLGRRAAAEPEPVLHPTAPQVTAAVAGRRRAHRAGDRRDRGRRRRPAGHRRRARPAGAARPCAGVLALHRLDVRAAKSRVERRPRHAACFAVRPRFGAPPVPEILADGVRAALDGKLPLAERLRQREADYRQDGAPGGAAAVLLARRRGQRGGDRGRGAGRGPRRAAAPDHGGARRGRARRQLGPHLDPRRRRRGRLLRRATPRATPIDPEQRRAGRRGPGDGDAPGGGDAAGRGRSRPRGGPTRRPPVPRTLSVPRATVGAERDGTVPTGGKETIAWTARLWPCSDCGDEHRVRPAAVHRRAHRRRRRRARSGPASTAAPRW